MRMGTIRTKDATMSHHRDTLVRELVDGSVEYLVGDGARSRDGWAALPADLVARVEWQVSP